MKSSECKYWLQYIQIFWLILTFWYNNFLYSWIMLLVWISCITKNYFFLSRVLTPEQRKCTEGLIVFSVKDKDMFGMSNQYLAEAYIHFKEVPDTETDIKGLPQVHLKLSRPTKLGEYLPTLNRSWIKFISWVRYCDQISQEANLILFGIFFPIKFCRILYYRLYYSLCNPSNQRLFMQKLNGFSIIVFSI